MVLNKELLQKYKDYLISLDFPFIKQNNDADIHKIFEKENRILLLSFLIKKYLPSYTNKIEEAQNDNKIDTFLMNIIYDNGFCRSAEKEPFIKGSLDEDKEIIIFNKIFHMLSLLHSTNSQPEMTEEDLKLKQAFIKFSDELKNQIIPEVNLFKTLSLPSKMTNIERKEKIDNYKEEIDNLKKILELEENEVKQSTDPQTFSTILKADDIAKLVADLKINISNFDLDNFVDFSNNKTGVTACSSKTELENFVATNSKEINTLLKTLEKKKDLNKFDAEENLSESISTQDDFSSSILQNYVMSNKIVEEASRNTEN